MLGPCLLTPTCESWSYQAQKDPRGPERRKKALVTWLVSQTGWECNPSFQATSHPSQSCLAPLGLHVDFHLLDGERARGPATAE